MTLTSECTETERLQADLRQLRLHYGQCLAELYRDMAKLSKEAYDAARDRRDTLRMQVDEAGRALKSHVNQHGCTI